MALKQDKVEKWRMIGKNVPKLEIIGPFSNQYTILIEDQDGDLIGLKPVDAERLIIRLQKALQAIADDRAIHTRKVAAR